MIPLHVWALWGALMAVALPVVIHMLTKPSGKVYTLPTMRFLMTSVTQQVRVSRLRDWFILVVRSLIIIILCTGFARLLQGDEKKQEETDGKTAKRLMIVLDASMSMMARSPGGMTYFDKAKSMAQKLLSQDVKEAEVVFVGARSRSVFDGFSSNLVALRDEIARATCTSETMDVNKALVFCSSILKTLKPEELKDCELVFFSDMQRSNWGRASFESLHKDLLLKLIPVKSVKNKDSNLALLNVAVEGQQELGATVLASCEVANLGDRDMEAELALSYGGNVYRRPAKIKAHSRRIVSIPLSLKEKGQHLGRFYLMDPHQDDLKVDDQTYFVTDVSETRHLVFITRSSQKEVNTAFLIRCALEAGSHTEIKVTYLPPDQLSLNKNLRADLVILSRLDILSAGQISVLGDYLASDLPLLYVAQEDSDVVNLSELSEHLGARLRMPVVFSLSTDDREDEDSSRFLVEVDTEKKPFQIFGQALYRFTKNLHFSSKIVSLDSKNNTANKEDVRARYSDGSAMLVVTPVNNTRLCVLNTDLQDKDRALAASALFVPLMRELYLELQGESLDTKHAVSSGNSYILTQRDKHIELNPEDMRLLNVETQQPVEEASWQHLADEERLSLVWNRAGQPGAYQAFVKGELWSALSVRAPAEESDLAILSTDVILKRLAKDRRSEVWTDEMIKNHDSKKKEWTKWFLLAACALMFVELLTLKAFKC